MSILSVFLVILVACSAIESRRNSNPGIRFNPGRRSSISECFRCSFYDCISMSLVCDGWDDCPTGTDEEGCDKVCNYPEYYRCSDSKLCMDSYHVCDGRNDCPNGEDESVMMCSMYSAGGREARMASFNKSLSYSLQLEDIHFRELSDEKN